jgi:hypothetical protein
MAGDPGIAAALAALIASPKVQYGLSSIRHALPSASGPFIGGNSKIGASPRDVNTFTYAHAGNNPFANIGNIANGIGAALGGQGQQDPLSQLYQSLIGQLQQPVNAPTGIDTADLMKQVQAAINPIYDSRENVARNQSTRAQADVKGLYSQLADDYKKLAPEQIAQSKDAQKQVADLYGQLRANEEGNYSRVVKQQGDEFKQLGIESALPDVLAKQQPAVTDALTAASENQAQQQQRYMDIGQMDANYYREGSPNSLMRGAEESTNLLNQLQDYIQQTEGERSSGIQSGYLQQLGQAQNSLAQQQSAASSETARRQQMLWQMLQSQMQSASKQQALTPDSFMSQLPQQEQQAVGSAFTQLQRSPEAVYGKVQDPRSPVPGTFVNTTPQWYEAQADKMLQDGSIDPVTHQALLMYLQLYFGSGSGSGN